MVKFESKGRCLREELIVSREAPRGRGGMAAELSASPKTLPGAVVLPTPDTSRRGARRRRAAGCGGVRMAVDLVATFSHYSFKVLEA